MIRTNRLLVTSLAALLLAAGCQGGEVKTVLSTVGSEVSPPAASGAPQAGDAGGGAAACPTSAPAPMETGQTATVTIETEKGTIAIKVEGDLSPNAAGNFVALAECGFYTGVVFHRLVPGFVIQGGDGEFGRDPNVDPGRVGSGGPGYTIQDEPVKGEYKRGTLAMARTNAPNSQGSQFFIVLDDEAGPILESYRTYAIFGEVTAGMDVVDAIAAMPNSGEPANQAIEPVAMSEVSVSRP